MLFRDRRFLVFGRYNEWCPATVRYWLETEVHVYGFSIAANVLLSFFPFLLVMASFCRYVLHWPAAEQAIYVGLGDYFAGETGEFLSRNLRATINSRGPMQITSLLLLLFTANGIFEPLEVALNRIWGITQNRSFLRNQLVSLGLIFACGSLALVSMVFTAMNQEFFARMMDISPRVLTNSGLLFFKMAAIPVSILMLFLVYWLLPNKRIRARDVVGVAILVGFALEVLKYVNLLVWPWMYEKLRHEYSIFVNSATIVIWSFFASMVVLAGAEWSVRRKGPPRERTEPDDAVVEVSTQNKGKS